MRTRPRLAPVPWSAFAGFRFPPDVIVLAVRWYLRFGLSYRDVEELLAERGVEVDHVTVYRWVQRFTWPWRSDSRWSRGSACSGSAQRNSALRPPHPAAEQELDDTAKLIRERAKPGPIRIEGHTDA
jgi:hypothetical protein